MKKTYTVRIIKILLVLALALGIYKGLDYIVTDDVSYFTRIGFHEFYDMEEVDSIFVGPSHSFKGINAETLSNELNKEFFMLSTSSQEVVGSYYLTKEAIDKFDIEELYVEISPSKMVEDVELSETKTYIITDYLKNPLLKLQYIFDVFEPNELINAFSRVRRNFNALARPSDIWMIPGKKDDNYKNFVPDEEVYSYSYLGRGCWTLEGSIADKGIWVNTNANAFDNVMPEDVGQEQIEYLNKIGELCKENNIKLTLFMMPYSELYLTKYTSYTTFVTYMESVAEQIGAEWLDLNLVKDEYLSLSDEEFLDYDHLNTKGNEKTTAFFVQYMNNPDGDYFYDTIEELKEAEPDKERVLAVEYEHTYWGENGEQHESRMGFEDIEKYRVTVTKKGIGDVYYKVYHRHGIGEVKDIKGEDIPFTQVEDNVIEFELPYEQAGVAFTVEVYDKATDECIYSAGK